MDYAVDGLGQLTSIVNRTSGGTPFSSFAYRYDDGGRRTRMTLLNGDYLQYGYDAADQVISAVRKTAAGALVPGYAYGYAYDEAGSMLTNTQNSLGRAMDYNNLNQLTNRYWASSTPSAIDVLGSVNAPGTGVTVNAESAQLRADGFFAATNIALSVGENSFTGIVQDAWGRAATNIVSATLATNRVFTYDANGNLLSDGHFTNTWNDADRLVAWEQGGTRLEFLYDGQGRRVIKREISGGTTNETRYIWDGWLPLAIQDGSGSVTEFQVWGRDLSGSLEGAGGIGGLLAVMDLEAGDTYEHFCDAQGNITEVLVDGEHIVASYQYAPFGAIVAASGAYDARYRFSSKEYDDASGLCYYGYRFYSPGLGRWISRDPIQERGGINLFSFLANNSPNRIDAFGTQMWEPVPYYPDCCDGVIFDGGSNCCLDDKIVSRDPVDTGAKRCCSFEGAIHIKIEPFIKHCWIEFEGHAWGLYGGYDPAGGFRGIVMPDDGLMSDPDKVCTPLKLSPCDYDIDGVKDCMRSGGQVCDYKWGLYDCRQWSRDFGNCLDGNRL